MGEVQPPKKPSLPEIIAEWLFHDVRHTRANSGETASPVEIWMIPKP
ncbi:MAG: hypothetical protein IT558_00055 [Alphaproteobacteria bacterium]|nr:hypothetical protein [Alphaproteobacteria bacterium]